jgi:hypothetical protein
MFRRFASAKDDPRPQKIKDEKDDSRPPLAARKRTKKRIPTNRSFLLRRGEKETTKCLGTRKQRSVFGISWRIGFHGE